MHKLDIFIQRNIVGERICKLMLQTGLSHGVAIIPNAPKQRFSDPQTGAHFEFEEMCRRLEQLKKKRFQEEMQASSKSKSLNK